MSSYGQDVLYLGVLAVLLLGIGLAARVAVIGLISLGWL